jgi:predicted Zn-dependent peptidase
MRSAGFFLLAAALSSQPASAELNLNRAEVSHLPNGLTLIMLEDHSFPLVSVQTLYKSGSAAESTGKTGLAHFLEHLAFRGSKNFPRGLATELIYDAGGEWHGYTAMDQTTYFSTMPKDGLDLLLKIEADRMARTVIDPASIEAEKGAVITELHSYENDPASVLQDAVTRTAIQAHPYGSPMAGYVSDVAKLTAEDARDYYASHYAPGNAVLAIAGDFDPPSARTLAFQEFADVPARPVAQPNPTDELPQRGERRLQLSGPVDRQYFLFAFPAPAASNPDFPAFLLVQEILSGGSGLNLQQSDWSGTRAVEGSMLFGETDDISSWLPPTHDPFLFMISGSIDRNANEATIEREIRRRIQAIGDRAPADPRLVAAKAAVIRSLRADVATTEDAAHQLAFFEGIGALDALLHMPERIAAVTAADVQRVARTYLREESSTVGWMAPGTSAAVRPGIGTPRSEADRQGTPPIKGPAGEPVIRRLAGGLPAIVQTNPLTDEVTVELLLSAPVEGGSHPDDLPGLDAVVRSGVAKDLEALVAQALAARREPQRRAESLSDDPQTRLQQLVLREIGTHPGTVPKPLAIIVSGSVDPERTFSMLERQIGGSTPGTLSKHPRAAPLPIPREVRSSISKPLAQGAIGYVVEGPKSGTREALAWQLLLYVLTHDYSGRLGRSAITAKGIVYHIYSNFRTDGSRTWAELSTGVDPEKADAMEVELKSQLSKLVSEAPSTGELQAARTHLLGRDLTAAQSNTELASKYAHEFVEDGGLRSHGTLRTELETITPEDLARAARALSAGTIIRVDVERASR